MHDPACRAWLSEFIDHWLKPPTQPSPPMAGPRTAPPRIAPPKPARANGSGGQRRAVSRVSTR